MLIEMWSPAFKEKGEQRPPIRFKEGLNVALGKEDGAMSIGKSSAPLVIDFVFGGNTYIKSGGVSKEGHHTIYFAFEFDGDRKYFPETQVLQILYMFVTAIMSLWVIAIQSRIFWSG